MPWVDSDGLERGLYAAEDYWGLPDDRRAELINGVLYDMAPPSTQHQAIVAGMVADLTLYVRGRGGPCRVYGVRWPFGLIAGPMTNRGWSLT